MQSKKNCEELKYIVGTKEDKNLLQLLVILFIKKISLHYITHEFKSEAYHLHNNILINWMSQQR